MLSSVDGGNVMQECTNHGHQVALATEFYSLAYQVVVATEFCSVAYQVAVATEFFSVTPDICGSLAWNLLRVPLFLSPIILSWLLGFWKMCEHRL
jgi:hypothetical protein